MKCNTSTSRKAMEPLNCNSSAIPVKPGQRYKAKTTIQAQKGALYSAYFSVILLDVNNKEISRYIRWIKDFSGRPIDYLIVFTAPPQADHAVIAFRGNHETPNKSDIKFNMPDPNSTKLSGAGNETEQYDNVNDYRLRVLPHLNAKQKKEMEERMVWIFGYERSGTTWLSNRLLKHTDNIIWYEPDIGIMFDAYLNRYDSGTKECNKVRRLDNLTESKFFLAKQHKDNWLPYLKELILARTYSQVRSLKHNIIIKDINYYGTDLIMECFSLSKYIFLIRDPRDSIESLLDKCQENSWGKQKPFEDAKKRYCYMKERARLWVRGIHTTMRAFEHLAPQRKLIIKYEDLRNNTFERLREIYEMIGIKMSDADLNAIVTRYDFKNIPDSEKGPGKFNRAAATGGWRQTFSQEEKDAVNPIIADTMKMLGYEM